MSKATLLALVLPLVASAQSSGPGMRDLMNASAFGTGGAFHAHGLGAETVIGNPAALVLHRRYQIELSGAWDASSKFAFANAAVVDSSSSELGAGVGYHLVTAGRGETQRTTHLSSLALAFPVVPALSLGVAGRYAIATGASDIKGITLDAGLTIRPIQPLAIGLSGHNLIDFGNADFGRYAVLSAAFLGSVFNVSAEARSDFPSAEAPLKPIFSGGAEFLAGGAFPLRAGYTFDSAALAHFVSGGLGVYGDEGGVDVAYRHELGGSTQMLALTFKLFIR
jgi:hypothetical protein